MCSEFSLNKNIMNLDKNSLPEIEDDRTFDHHGDNACPRI